MPRYSALLLSATLACCHSALADTIIFPTGERLAGKVVSEDATNVVFESKALGRIEVPRARIEKIERTEPAFTPPAPSIVAPPLTLSTNAPTEAAAAPRRRLFSPAPLRDNNDWIQLKSGEWLKGRLHAMQNRKLEFDSDELKDLSFDWKDVRQVHLPKGFIAYGDRQTASGELHVDEQTVTVTGEEQLQIPRAELEGITPGEPRELNFWSGKLDLGLNLRSGNTEQADLYAKIKIERRTPKTHLKLDYAVNFSELDGTENVDNQHGTLFADISLSRRWFLRALSLDYYRDPFQNIAHRATVGVGAGYYLIDRPRLEWLVNGGPAYQFTRFDTVESGNPSENSAASLQLGSDFDWEITRRIQLEIGYSANVVGQESGGIIHHSVTTLDLELTRRLDLDVSFTWDRTSNPQPESNGNVPKPDDFRLNLSLGIKF